MSLGPTVIEKVGLVPLFGNKLNDERYQIRNRWPSWFGTRSLYILLILDHWCETGEDWRTRHPLCPDRRDWSYYFGLSDEDMELIEAAVEGVGLR